MNTKKRILLVDDDEFFQKFYGAELTQHGFDVTIAGDGEEALVKLKATHPDLMILDIIMPKRDGFDVLSNLREHPEFRNLPILIFSTLGQESDVTRAMSLGAKDYVNKSFFDFDTLLAKINTLI